MLDSQKHNYILILYSCVFDYQASAINFMILINTTGMSYLKVNFTNCCSFTHELYTVTSERIMDMEG